MTNGRPGIVSDEYLNAISADTTTTAAELCAAVMWRGVDVGYRVLDPALVQFAADLLGADGACPRVLRGDRWAELGKDLVEPARTVSSRTQSR